MKTTKLTALILSILMIISMLPTTIFAAPSAVTVADSANEHELEHEHEQEHTQETAELFAIAVEPGDHIGDNFYVNQIFAQCNVCGDHVYFPSDVDHSIWVESVKFDYTTTPGKFTATFVFGFCDCESVTTFTPETTQTFSFDCTEKFLTVFSGKITGSKRYCYMQILREATDHEESDATCQETGNCYLCNAECTADHNYSSEYTQVVSGTTYKHRRMCTTSGCTEYTDEGDCSSASTANCITGTFCSTCNEAIAGADPSTHAGSPDENGIYSCCGVGTEPTLLNGVYQISTPGHLVWFKDYVNEGNTSANAILLSDLDMTGVTWEPIASTALYYAANPTTDSEWGYKGTFDGNGKAIRNLTVAGSSEVDATFGLFGTLNGTIKHLGVENFTYTGAGMDSRVGAIVGQILGGTVSDCYARNVNINTQIGTQDGVAGGLAGCNYSGTIENSYIVKLTVSAGRKGGIVGDNCGDGNNANGTDRPGTITNCFTDYSSLYERSGSYKATGEASISDARFASGEICYLLNGSQSDCAWKQTLGSDGYPSFTGETVYCGYEACDSTSVSYSNTELSSIPGHKDTDGDYICDYNCGYIFGIMVDLGARADETNVRYAEISGVVIAIEENEDKYLVEIGEENLLIEVVEKTADGEFVKSQYFYVDMTEKAAAKLDMDSYMTTDGNASIRTSNPMGMRFKSSVLTSVKNEEVEFVIDEYGFIVATEDALGETELTLDFSKYVTGVAYNKESGTDIVFDASNDEVHIFSGYVKNIPAAQYKTNLVCKTYTKLTVGGESFVVYGEAVTGNVYDTASAILEDNTLDSETREKLTQILLDYENTLGIPGDGLYPEE